MSNIDWGIVCGLGSLLLLQIGFAVGAIVLFFTQKVEVSKGREATADYRSRFNSMESQFTKVEKAFESLQAKFEKLKDAKVDGWEDACTELKKDIKAVNARISTVQRTIKYSKQDEPEEDVIEEPYQGMYVPEQAPVDTQHQNGSAMPEGFGSKK